MKCSYCGSRLKKSDEICPNCSKYVSENKVKIEVPETVINSVKAEKPESHISPKDIVFSYKDFSGEKMFSTVIIALVLFIVVTISALRNFSNNFFSVIFVAAFIIIGVVSSVLTYKQEQNCSITITDDKVSGTVPSGMLETTDFEVKISDIVCVEKEGFYSKHSTPKIIIVTAENRIEIKASSTKMLERFKNTLQERIVENETDI